MTLFQLFDEWFNEHVLVYNAENTIFLRKQYIIIYKKNFENKDITDITSTDVNNYVKRNKHLSRTTLYSQIKILSSIFNYAIRKKYLEYNVCKEINFKSLKKPKMIYVNYSKKYVKQIIKLFKKTDLFLAIYIYIALETGMRKEELLGLKWDCVDLKTRKIVVKQALINVAGKAILKETKTGNIRVINISKRLAHILRKYKKKAKAEFIIDNFSSPQMFTNAFCKIIKSSNIEHIAFKDLRHINACMMLNNSKNNANIYEIVRERLGHASIITTFNNYYRLQINAQKKVVKKIEKYLY